MKLCPVDPIKSSRKLLPCPFCGNTNIRVEEEDMINDTWDVSCCGDNMDPNSHHCGAYLEGFTTEWYAIRTWNRRVK